MFQPILKTSGMHNVPASWDLLGGEHLLAAHGADLVAHLVGQGIGEELHARERRLVLPEVGDGAVDSAPAEVDAPDHVEGEAGGPGDGDEEDGVEDHLDDGGDEVEDHHARGLAVAPVDVRLALLPAEEGDGEAEAGGLGEEGEDEKDVLEGEEHDDGGPLGEQLGDCPAELQRVDGEEQRDEQRDTQRRGEGEGRGLPKVDALLEEPVQRLEQQQAHEQRHGAAVQVPSEDGQVQQQLEQRGRELLPQVFHLGGPQAAEGEAADAHPEQHQLRDEQVDHHQAAAVGRNQMHQGGEHLPIVHVEHLACRHGSQGNAACNIGWSRQWNILYSEHF